MISKIYQQNFQEFTELLDKNKIPYCLVAGTLLGSIREGNFLKHDEDIDIGVPLEYIEKVKVMIENSAWHYFAIWRREFSIIKHGFPKYDSKVDIFFLEEDKVNTYMYSYKKNPFHGEWDIEWRMVFPKECFQNFKRWKISDIPIYIPNKPEKIFELEYGPDWKKSNPKWNTYDCLNYDKDYKEIGIIIPTFLRDNKLEKLINSIKNTYHSDWYRLYIADQGYYDPNKEKWYKSLRVDGHNISFLPFNCGLAYTRNYLVSKVKEPFVLIVDDDFLVNNHTNLSNFISILNSEEKIGVIGGDLKGHQQYDYDLFYDDTKKIIYYIKLKNRPARLSQKTYVQKQIPYKYCDIVLNFAMFKTEVFKDFCWDTSLKLAEHSDFYIRFKKENKWKVTYTDTVEANHQNEPDSHDYTELRRKINVNLGIKLIENKWGFTSDKNIVILKE